MNTLTGSLLHPQDRKYVLAAYVHRFTGSHTPNWARVAAAAGKPVYVVQFRDDDDWLANTRFRVRKDGRLDMRSHSCESNPTWPNGRPELQGE